MLELKQGTLLADRYALVRRLGGDTRTQLWQANDRLTGTSVALKIAGGDAKSEARLRAEWQVSIRLMHAHIVRAFEFHAEPEAAFFSQQFVAGPDFSALSGLAADEVLGPVGLLATALAYIHSKGIVHRDIKTSNVLLDANGAPYLSDFDVSGAAGEHVSGGSLVAQSPQSLVGEAAAASDDVFALGGLMYELLSGRSPWPDDAMESSIRQANVRPLRAADGTQLPQPVVDLVLQMLDPIADARPDASEVVERLAAAGFTPRPATISMAAKRERDDIVGESIESIRPVPRRETDVTSSLRRPSAHINRSFLLAAFAGLIAILIVVIFVLPDSVRQHADDRQVSEPVASDADIPAAVLAPRDDAADRDTIYVDPELRRRLRGESDNPTRTLDGDEDITFSENAADYSGLDKQGRARFDAESTLGELLSAFEVLELRGVDRWAPREYRVARDYYADGDAAYLKKDFSYAEELYLGSLTALEPLYERIEPTFAKAYREAKVAFDAGDRLEAVRLFELAVAVTPGHPGAEAGYQRAKNLQTVLQLVEQGLEYEEDLELEAAQRSFEQAVELDSLWQPAHEGVRRVREIRTKVEFDTRMSEGFAAIMDEDYLAARAAFRVAQQLIPGSSEPADGLLQVDQGLRLQDIATLEREALSLQQDEHWDAVVKTFEEILTVDNTLAFASDGLERAREMSALHTHLDKLIAEPDKLSSPSRMQEATLLVVNITTRSEVGPRLSGQRDELSRLLKRAVTPLAVHFVSDNVTEVSVYKVGKLGNFMRKDLNLRPGTYVAVGSRPGYRDVRLEFRVAPEVEFGPVIIQCEERI